MDEVRDIVARVLKVPAESVSPEMSPERTPSWDSMNHLLLVSELERAFGVRFTMDDVMSAKTLGDLLEALRAKGTALGV